MKAFRNPFLLVVLFCTLFLVKCTCPGSEDEDTLIKKIAKEWKISTLTVGGNAVADTDNFVLALNQTGDQPTNFTLTPGGIAYNFAGANSGSWSVNNVENPTQATFAGNTVDFTASENQLTVQYKVAKEVDKNEPVVRFVLVPKN